MADVLLPGGAGDDGGDGTQTGVQPVEINVEMERSFLEYAMSVIVQRALPDAGMASSPSTAGSSTRCTSRTTGRTGRT